MPIREESLCVDDTYRRHDEYWSIAILDGGAIYTTRLHLSVWIFATNSE